MWLINKILDVPSIWSFSQYIFGCDKQKIKLYHDKIPNPGRILDFGCANGNTFPAFSECDYYGLDLDKKLIEQAKKKFSSYPNARFICANILDEPFSDNFFNNVLFACTGHHVTDETMTPIFRSICGTLKKGGSLYIVDTIRTENDSPFLKFKHKLDRGHFIKSENEYRDFLSKISDVFLVEDIEVFEIKGAFTEQPMYLYAKLTKK